MVDDWFLSRITAVEQAAQAVVETFRSSFGVLERAQRDRLEGVPIVRIAQELAASGAGQRREVAAAYRAYERSVAALRAATVRALVDEEGISMGVLAAQMGISRQAVSRLYQTAPPPPNPDV